MGYFLNVDNKIKLACYMCGRLNEEDFDKYFYYIYPFTTENIAGYMPLLNFKNKSLLTVGSSGDQVLNAILHGCSDIVVADLCPFIKEYFYLKLAAVMVLSREEFLDFFGSTRNILDPNININRDTFNNALYDRIKNTLRYFDNESEYFWSELFNKYDGIEIRYNIFNIDEKRSNVIVKINEYLKNDYLYNTLRNNIMNLHIEFMIGDIFNINLNRKFDNINLSNIASYYDLDKMVKLFDKLKYLLNDGGKMLIAYLYATFVGNPFYNNAEEDDIKYIADSISAYSEKIDLDSFVGIRGIMFDDTIYDSVLTYSKRKKK